MVRRYIEGLDAPYIYALAETATSDQVESLRTVIAAYLSFETFFGFSTMVCVASEMVLDLADLLAGLLSYIPVINVHDFSCGHHE
jgi:hypothetical protein